MKIRQGVFSLSWSLPVFLQSHSPRAAAGICSMPVLFHWLTLSHLINHLSQCGSFQCLQKAMVLIFLYQIEVKYNNSQSQDISQECPHLIFREKSRLLKPEHEQQDLRKFHRFVHLCKCVIARRSGQLSEMMWQENKANKLCVFKKTHYSNQI